MTFQPVNTRSARWLWLLPALIAVAMLLPTFLLGRTWVGAANMSYELTPTDLVIHFAGEPARISRSDITEVQIYDRLTEGRRLMGTAIPGLYEGRWSFKETGRISLFASTTGNLVVIRTADHAWGITPAEQAAFVGSLKAGETGAWSPVRGQSPGFFIVPFLIFITLALGVVIAVLTYYIRLPRSIRYHLTDDAVVIEGGRLRVALPYGEITRAEVVSPPGYPWRLFGSQLPGQVWGTFKWKGLPGKLRIYATQTKPLVAITAGNVTYGISPAEQERFVAELQKKIVGM
ncbi:MAG: hypothetical protein K0R39_4309 [Symbiobacteriaceae bacterium]|jgi:hypothetical protein|nr:hypothetical protein [Symbiobacteriaceae bacterium]